jgi:hypothetical protein
MRLPGRAPVWPYVCLVVCLFVLAVLSPKGWESLVREREAAWSKRVLPVALPDEDRAAERARAEAAEFPQASTAPPSDSPGLAELEAMAAGPELVSTRPPVADLVEARRPVDLEPLLPPTIESPPSLSPDPNEAAPPPPSPESSPLDQVPAERRGPDPSPVLPWPRAESLMVQLEELSHEAPCRDWAQAAMRELEAVASLPELADPAAPPIFARLRAQVAQIEGLEATVVSERIQAQWRRAGYAITRRVAVWEQVHAIAAAPVNVSLPASGHERILHPRIDAIEAALGDRPEATGWKKYLRLAELRAAAEGTGAEADADRRKLAAQVLGRLRGTQLAPEQRKFLQDEMFAALESSLRRWAAEPVDYVDFLGDIERYELSRTTADANPVARQCAMLRWSQDEAMLKLGDLVDAHYRNANMRVAITADFINRLLPDLEPIEEDVDDYILGASVYGRSRTSTRLLVRLLPDRRNLRIGLEARGNVFSETASSKGGATFFDSGESSYVARKLLLVDRRGIRVGRASADASTYTDLTGVETDLDILPFFGSFARAIAIQQYDSNWSSAILEAEGRVASRASRRLDHEVQVRLAQAQERFRSKVLDPLDKLGLEPAALELQTTDDRATIRARLAGELQLAAFTPRPRAPGDSLLSLQIHESALNNILDRLELDGRRVGIRDLYRQLADAFGRADVAIPEDLPDDVTVEFAPSEAVRVRCDGGQITLTIRLAELAQGNDRRWRHFTVEGHYRPDTSGLNADLVREGVVELAGERLGLRDQIALRAIFSKVLSRSRGLNLIPDHIVTDPRMADLTVTQFEVDSGWIGVAVGPRLVARKLDRRE